MDNNTKRKLKNAAKTGGKFTLAGLKMAGKGVLSATELTSKAVRDVARSENAKRLISKAAVIAATVAFPAPAIMLTGMKYMIDSCVLGDKVSAIDSLFGTFRTSEKIMKGILDIVAVPTEIAAIGVQEMSKFGKKALNSGKSNNDLDR